LNLPIVIAATETKTLSYRFTAPIEFDFDEMINIEAEPCGIIKLLNIKYTNRPIEFSPDKWAVDFGDNNFCTFTAPQTQTIELVFSGNLATNPKIAGFEDFQKSCFSSDLSVGQSLTYTNTITISFDPSAEGEYIDSLVVYLDPGNKRRVAYVWGKINQTDYSIDKQTLDFGTFGLGGSGSEQFTISNTGSTTVTIDNISGVSPPYSYNAANPSLPFDINPNETKDIIIDYMSAEPFSQKFSINVLFGDPCTADSIIVLNAKTYDDRTAVVKIATSAEIRGTAGDIKIFPIYFELDKNYSAAEVNITSIKGVFRTNPTLLKMLDVKVGTSLALASVLGLTFNEDTPGRVEFS
ncbi:MAG: hypothetical protein KAH48_06340, partial [Chlorobi bacterium]|nr:hypothetical protein [Chlorobiota bacterium]